MRAHRPRRAARGAAAAGALALAVVTSAPARGTSRGEIDAYGFRAGNGQPRRLPAPLREVSGLAATADGRVLAHGDERGVVYEIDPARGRVVKAFSLGTPPPRDDFEGIAVAGPRIFLVTSGGRLYETREAADGAAAPVAVRDTRLGALCEIEGLAYDPADGSLVIPCKQPIAPALRGSVTLFRWSVARGALAARPRITIPLADAVRGTGLAAFHPSSIERVARSGHYLVVAGPQHALLEITADGAVVASHVLRPKSHRQPEGLTFVGDSVALLADEGGGKGGGKGGEKGGVLTVYRRAP